ncbi:uncharacterized protein TM35_000103080 [Trypanosoma theileri]|uniref:Mucin-associated surface protein (MASP) n=1 Tax=Trypanosoma theileri TaxID=67003 RepID=A0A1X0P0U1_9TRYP|nr:uncharacterized protein TM35_000103080 [Trypanosoma theileri]ORC90040.1 hypothetical protein TM35_000103080 [Trypanosoma theileri]
MRGALMMRCYLLCLLTLALCCACGLVWADGPKASDALIKTSAVGVPSLLHHAIPSGGGLGEAGEAANMHKAHKEELRGTLPTEAEEEVVPDPLCPGTGGSSPSGSDSSNCPSGHSSGLAEPQAEPRDQGKPPGGVVADPQRDISEGDEQLGVKLPSVGGTSSGSLDPSTVSLPEPQGGGGNNGLGGHVQPSTVDQNALSRDSQILKDSSGDLLHKEKEPMQGEEIPQLDPKRKEEPHKPAENQPGRQDPVEPPRQEDNKQSTPPAQAPDGPVTPTSPTAEERVDVPTAEGGSETATQPSPSPNTSATGSSDVSDATATQNNISSAESESTNNQNEEGVTGNTDTTTTTNTTTTTTTLPPELTNNKKGDADSSSSISSSVWVRVPLLIVVTLACILVC